MLSNAAVALLVDNGGIAVAVSALAGVAKTIIAASGIKQRNSRRVRFGFDLWFIELGSLLGKG